ncbi:ComEA family DNA-binding protein [Nodularia chucula]|uniref:ComEA family DNA-binding protein n=1 Tax=Nodularia chucula TaxID=3093667 RepID=UPI0039C6F0A7
MREFQRLYADVRLGVPIFVQERIAKEEKQCPQIAAPTSIVDSTPININTATLEELVTLPGIGEQLGKRIIIARQQEKFTSLDDLAQVSGISTRMTQQWRDRIIW